MPLIHVYPNQSYPLTQNSPSIQVKSRSKKTLDLSFMILFLFLYIYINFLPGYFPSSIPELNMANVLQIFNLKTVLFKIFHSTFFIHDDFHHLDFL